MEQCVWPTTVRSLRRHKLGNYTAAKEDYTKLQRLNPRSQEALFGLAKVAAKESNYGLASEYMSLGSA